MLSIVNKGTNLIDIAIDKYKNIEVLFSLAIANGLGICDDVSNNLIETPVFENIQKYIQKIDKNAVTEIKAINVLAFQELIDIAIQEIGTVDGLFELAMLNGIGITDKLNITSLYKLSNILDNNVVKNLNKFKPASGITENNEPPGGIGYMQITKTFKVS